MPSSTRNQTSSQLTRFPTASGALTRLAYRHAVEGNLVAGPLLRIAGLTLQQIDNTTLRLSVKSQITLLNLVAAGLDDELFGFHLALDFDLREIGTLYYIMASSETLGDALQRASRYSRITNEAVHLKYHKHRNIVITFEYVDVARHQDRHQIEFFMVALVRLARHLSGHNLLPIRVTVMHHRNGFHPAFKSFFGCDIAFGGPMDEIVFASSVQPIPLTSADPFLHAMLIAQCEQLHVDRLRSATLRASVENEIAPLLPHGNAQVSEISRKLGMSQRTLARHLAAEGLSFMVILDEMKFDLARHYLMESDLPITTIAWLLGYQETSALTHAFKRWTGKTPKQARMDSNAKWAAHAPLKAAVKKRH
jgi:AraC-like DNA-binding protein